MNISARIRLMISCAALLVAASCGSTAPGGHADPSNGGHEDSAGGVGLSSPTSKAAQQACTPDAALAALRAGNARFADGLTVGHDLLDEVHASAAGQYPFAVVLSCLDSRQPVELVFDQGIGDLFSARLAGNVLDDDVLGSMEFGCKLAGAKLIAVIGHTSCGAVKGACDGAQLGHLTGLLAHIQPAIDEVPASVQPRTSKNAAFVEEVAQNNVRLVMHQIAERSPILREMLDRGEIGLVGGIYDVHTGKVAFFPEEGR